MNWKKLGIWVGIAFVVFYLITQPTNAADAVNGAVGWVQSAANSLSTFVASLGEW